VAHNPNKWHSSIKLPQNKTKRDRDGIGEAEGERGREKESRKIHMHYNKYASCNVVAQEIEKGRPYDFFKSS
jgi:hypothetical protein